jgi:hypothetical protein
VSSTMSEQQQATGITRVVQLRWDATVVDPLLTHGRRLRAHPVRLLTAGDSISAMGWGFVESEPEVPLGSIS